MLNASKVRPGVERGMPRPPSSAVQIAIRLPQEWLDEAEALGKLMGRPGFATTRSDVLRAALARGLEALREEHPRPTKKNAKR